MPLFGSAPFLGDNKKTSRLFFNHGSHGEGTAPDVFDGVAGILAKDHIDTAGAIVGLAVTFIPPRRDSLGTPAPGKVGVCLHIPAKFPEDLERQVLCIQGVQIGIVRLFPDLVDQACLFPLEGVGAKAFWESSRRFAGKILNDSARGDLIGGKSPKPCTQQATDD